MTMTLTRRIIGGVALMLVLLTVAAVRADEAEDKAVLAIAKGAISLRMIRREIDRVATFAARHPEGWCYLADVRGVRLLNPLNLVALQRIRRLPGVRRRVIVVPRLARRLEPIAIGELTTSVANALARC